MILAILKRVAIGVGAATLLVIVLAPVCYGIAMNYVRRFRDLDQTVMVTWAFSFGALALLPLAAGIEIAAVLSEMIQRRGGTPTVVCLTDGRANVGRSGAKGREQALNDALESAAALRVAGVRCMVIDTSPRPHTNAARLAESLDGVYLPLPHADAAKLSDAVQTVGRSQTVARGGG